VSAGKTRDRDSLPFSDFQFDEPFAARK